MGFIERRSGEARYRDPLGRQRSKTFARKADAQRFLLEMESDKARGGWIDPRGGEMPLAIWAEEFMLSSGGFSGLVGLMTTIDGTRGRPGIKARKAGETNLIPLLDVHEVAQWLGVGERHVRRLVFERRIPYVKWGRLVRFDPGELATWLDSQRSEARR